MHTVYDNTIIKQKVRELSNNMLGQGTYNYDSRNLHDNWWPNVQVQPLLDQLKQNSTSGIDCKDIAQCSILSGRTAAQVKGNQNDLNLPNVHGARFNTWSPEENARILELYERTEATNLIQKSIQAAETRRAVTWRYYSLKKKAAEEAAKNVLAVSETALAIGDTTQCNTNDAAGIHKEESAHQMDPKIIVAENKIEEGAKGKNRGSRPFWTERELQALLNLQLYVCRDKWDIIAKHPDLAGRTVRQIKSKWSNMRERGLNKNSIIDLMRETINKWTKEEEEPLRDLMKHSTTGRIEWKDIAKFQVLAGRTTKQIKDKWYHLKKSVPGRDGTGHARSLPEVKSHARTGPGNVFQNSIRVEEASPGPIQCAVKTRYDNVRKHVQEEATKNVCAVSEAASASVDDALTAQCNTNVAAGIHKEEDTTLLDNMRLPVGLVGRSERAKSRGDCPDIGASEQHGLNSAADDAVPLATKKRSRTSMCSSNHSSMHAAAAGSATPTSGTKISPTKKKRERRAVSPSVITRQVPQGEDKNLPHFLLAPTYGTDWVSLSPEKNEEVFNGIVSWPLFDDVA
jgi:hypothetical protein